MFINHARDGRNNLCGQKIARYRKEMKLSQRAFAAMLQLENIDIAKNAVQRIESGERFVTDIELTVIARVLNRPLHDIIDPDLIPRQE